MELFVTIIHSWKYSTTVTKSSVLDDSRRLVLLYSKFDFAITVENVSVMKSFWIELDGFFWETKINFIKPGPLSTSKIELLVIIVDSWKLLTSVSSGPDPPWLNYGIQKTEKGCSNVSSVVVYLDGERPLFVFIPNPKCNQDFNEFILETLSMSEKALKILLNIFSNVNDAGRLVWVQLSILKSELY